MIRLYKAFGVILSLPADRLFPGFDQPHRAFYLALANMALELPVLDRVRDDELLLDDLFLIAMACMDKALFFDPSGLIKDLILILLIIQFR